MLAASYERAWASGCCCKIAGVGPEGPVVRRRSRRSPLPRLRSVWGYPLGEALCCDVTLVSPLTRDGRPQPSATTRDGAMISVAERRKRAAYHELCARGSSAYASARAKLADAGVLNRSALSRNSCGFALLLPCAVQLPRVGCAAAWWCLLSVCFAQHACCDASRHAIHRWGHAWFSAPRGRGRPARRRPPPPRAAWARSLQRAGGPGLVSAGLQNAWEKKITSGCFSTRL